MLEEEKLARDTYTALEAHWGTAVFANIKASEQQHMDKVNGLLEKFGVPYTMMPAGVYADSTLQELYDQFMVDGLVSELQALHIGATIEDLDIVDLQQRMDATGNVDIDAVFAKLQCGSGNHLRSFVGGHHHDGRHLRATVPGPGRLCRHPGRIQWLLWGRVRRIGIPQLAESDGSTRTGPVDIAPQGLYTMGGKRRQLSSFRSALQRRAISSSPPGRSPCPASNKSSWLGAGDPGTGWNTRATRSSSCWPPRSR